MQYIEPEMRENAGEIAIAEKEKLPKLITQKDVKGDLHCHSHWNIKGPGGIKALIKKAKSLGYKYLGISDHTKFLAIEHGLNEKELLAQNQYIKKLNHNLKAKSYNLKILHGCEANILADGSIDIDDKTLAKLDFVIAGVHSQLKMPKERMTARIIKAMKNPNVDIIAHPTGRVLQRRDEYQIDFDRILEVARETGTILEINAHPARLDLKDVNIRKAKNAGVKMAMGTDAHRPEQMDLMEYGVAQARRGWAEKEDIINTLSLNKLLKIFKK
jgi:DNA polymerase (family 10)